MKEIILKYKDKAVYLISMMLFVVISYMSVKYCNAGHSYEQDLPFRVACISIALIVLINLPLKDTLTVWSVIWIPICYFITHVGYEKHWIPDNCDYQFVELIRLGKLVALTWGLMIIAVIKNIVREDLVRKFLAWINEAGRLKKTVALLWILYAAVLTVINPGYEYVIVFTIGFPAALVACREKEKAKALLNAYLDGMLLCFLILSVKSMLHRPYDTERYLFYFSNENMAGMYLSVIMITMVYRLGKAWAMAKSRLRTLFLIAGHLLIVWTGVLVMFNYTRTYLLGMGFSLFVYFCVRLFVHREKKAFLLRFFLPVILIIVCFYPGYLTLRYLPAFSNDPVYFTGEWGNDTRVQPDDPIDSPHYTSIKRYLRLAFGKLGISLDLDDGEQREEQSSFVEIEEDRDVSNGRMFVWKNFLQRMNIRGHYPGHIVLDGDWVIYHAHNTYFQNMFQFGIPVGLFFGLLILLTYIFAVISFAKKRSGSFAMLAMGNMMVAMLTEWSGHPAYPFGMFLLLTLLCLVFTKTADEKADDKADGSSEVAEGK